MGRAWAIGCLTACVWLAVGQIPAFADGFRIHDQSASGTAQGNAIAAQGTDASTLHYNAAGLTQLRGVQFSGGLLFLGASTTYRSEGGARVKGSYGGNVVFPAPMHLYLTANLRDVASGWLEDWSLGLGVNNPYGLLVSYPADSPVAPVTTSVELPILDFKPTVALKINDYISIGAGLDIYTFVSFVGEGQGQVQQTPAPGTTVEANGTDVALGFTASALWTPIRNSLGDPLLNLGFVYRSHARMKLEGELLTNGLLVADARATVRLPQVVTGAIAVWPVRDEYREWKVEVDVDYSDWSDYKDLNLALSNGVTIPQPRNYGDAFVFMAGTEHAWLQPEALPNWHVALRAGYMFAQSPVPSSTFDGAPANAPYHAPSVGVGLLCHEQGRLFGSWRCGDFGVRSLGIDLAYQVLLFQERSINNSRTPAQINGTWDTTIHVGALTVRVNF